MSVLCLLGASAASVAASSPQSGWPAATFSACPGNRTSAATDGHFRVFACADGSHPVGDVELALRDLAELWGPMTGMMGIPIEDKELKGENGRIDVYLLGAKQALTREGVKNEVGSNKDGKSIRDQPGVIVNGTAITSSGYILANRPEAYSGTSYFKSVLAHEFFHVLQFHYNNFATCPDFWFAEASATWAEWFFVPEAAGDAVYPYYKDFQDTPGLSLTAPSAAGSSRAYGEFVWPLFMQEQEGFPGIKRAWVRMTGDTTCEELNAAVGSEWSFSKHFRDFAVENFDTRLKNEITGRLGWPDYFGEDYPDYTRAFNPKFPLMSLWSTRLWCCDQVKRAR